MNDVVFLRRVALTLLLVVLALFLWRIRDVLLLVFGAILFAVLLESLAVWFSSRAGLSYGWSLAVAVVALIGLVAAGAALFGAQIAAQFAELSQSLPRSIESLRKGIERLSFGPLILEQLKTVSVESAGGTLLSVVRTALTSLIDALANLLLVMFAGLFFAVQPDLYRRGALRLVPKARRTQVRDLLRATGAALRQWLLAQLATMVAVGAVTGAGLWLLGVPAPLALGVIAGLAEFIPIVGPILAAVPAILLAATDDAARAIYVIVFYIVLQQVEGYVIYPLIQRSIVSLPPAVTMFALVIAGALFGPLGVLFATPLAVVVIVWVNMLYLQDTLGQKVEVPGQ